MITPHRHRRFVLHPVLIAWLTVVWVMLWSDLSVGNVLGGILVSIVVTIVLPLNPVPLEAVLRPRAAAILVGQLAVDIVKASFQVVVVALRPGRVPYGAVVRVRLRSHSDVVLTMAAEISSLVPGSIVIEARRLTGTLYVHLLDVEMSGGIDAAVESVLALERRILYAIAPVPEIEAAGLPAPTWWGQPPRARRTRAEVPR